MKKYFYIVLSLVFTACIDPVDIDSDDFQETLVVEGKITTDPGPHIISLNKSAKYGSVFDGTIRPVERAGVTVRDNEGNTTILSYEGEGLYATPASFRAETGKSYVLNIEIDDITYNSLPETVLPVNTLDSLYIINARYPFLNENKDLAYKLGVDIYAKYSKSDVTSSFYLWDFYGVHAVQTFPELFEVATRRGPVPRPKDCCSDCFKFEQNNEIIISSFPLGANATNKKITFIQDNGYRFLDKYVLILKRYSISREAYQFYDLLLNQLSIDGDIFDPPPAAITGNIININDVDEQVIGYFQVSDVATDTVEISSADLNEIAPLPIFPDDCRVLPNTTTERPSYY